MTSMRNEERELLEAFHLFDQDRDGMVSMWEMREGLHRMAGTEVTLTQIILFDV